MVVELDQQGSNKVQITASPQVAPHKCCNCGFSGQQYGRYFIDFGVDIEYYGTILLCSDCFGETANRLGWITPEAHEKLTDVIADLLEQNSILREVKDKYDAIVSAVGPIARDDDRPSSVSLDPEQVNEVGSLKPRFIDPVAAAADSGVSEPADSEGFSDLLSSAKSVLDL